MRWLKRRRGTPRQIGKPFPVDAKKKLPKIMQTTFPSGKNGKKPFLIKPKRYPHFRGLLTKRDYKGEIISWKEAKRDSLEAIRKLGVEKGIKPLVDAINEQPFMVSVSSCEGHPELTEEHRCAYVNFLVRRKDRLKVMKIFDEEVLAYEGVEIEDRTKEFTLHDFYIAGFPEDALYLTIRIDMFRVSKAQRDEIISLLAKKIKQKRKSDER